MKNKSWKRILFFLIGNIAAQGLASLTGLLLARWLSVEDYGIYTIVITMMGVIAVLTKGGSQLGYTAILGRIWPNTVRATEAVSAALLVRKKLSIFIIPPTIIITITLLRYNDASWEETLLITSILLIFWWADMKTRLVDQILIFSKQTTRLQILDSIVALLRLFIVSAFYYSGYLSLLNAIAVSVLVSVLRVRPIMKWVGQVLPHGYKSNPPKADLKEIQKSVKYQLPVDIYNVFQIQIIIFALSVLGSTSDVAAFGAITRINQLLLPIEALAYAFVIPMFSRASPERAIHIYVPLIIILMLPGFSLVLISWLHPQVILYLVGQNYAHLETELLIASIVFACARGSQMSWNLLAHRGHVKFSWIQIPVGLTSCIFLLSIIDVSTISGALLLQLMQVAGFASAAIMEYSSVIRSRNNK